jgi:hypothetical protein
LLVASLVLAAACCTSGPAPGSGCNGGRKARTPQSESNGREQLEHSQTGATSASAAGELADATRGAPRRNQRSALGINLDGVKDWSSELPFVDVFKLARAWISGTASEYADRRQLDVDAHGWLRALLPGQLARARVITDVELRAGTYVVLYEGEGTIGYAPELAVSHTRPGHDELRIEPGTTMLELQVSAINPQNPLRNIHVVLPGGTCENDAARACDTSVACDSGIRCVPFEQSYATQIFNPDFLASVQPYAVLRFMDWMQTNNSKQARWQDRPSVDDAVWSKKGVPLEIMIELANRLHAEPWLNLPHLADDDYIDHFARLTKRRLDSSLKPWIELSNEVWNDGFAQAGYAREHGIAAGLGRGNPELAQAEFYARRSVQVFAIWERAWGGASRLLRVLASQAASSWRSEQILDFEDAKSHADALAVAPYMGWVVGPEQRDRMKSLTLDRMFSEAKARALPEAIAFMREQASVARRRGLRLVAYEGGQHLVGVQGVENDPAIVASMVAFNRDPRIRALYAEYLAGWRKAGGQTFVHFSHCAHADKWGSWGSIERLGDEHVAPKSAALLDFISRNPRWW